MNPAARNDLGIYERYAAEWWDELSPRFRSLHGVNRLRLELLDAWVGDEIAGRRIADLGCGGGLVSEPLARRGAQVVGIDIGAASIAAARAHASRLAGAAPYYMLGDLRAVPAQDGAFDGVVLADVLEHIEEPRDALAEASRILRPGGWLFASSIARTRRARFLAVTLAEGIGLIAKGTHDPRLFIDPAELDDAAAAVGLVRRERTGETPDWIRTLCHRAIRLRRSSSLALAYSALYRKGTRP
jgi:2-polyprenyl-6-hydroxyphenyl methylase/3-demethylubiquinone-9 3-methyltransferase